jgi:hypothetical protein
MTNNKNQQARQQVQIGRRVATLPAIASPAAKLAARVERDAKAAEATRKLQAENAQLRRDNEFFQAEKDVEKILVGPGDGSPGLIELRKLSKIQVHALTNALNGGLARHKAKNLPARAFDAWAVINREMVRFEKAVPPPPKNASPTLAALPPPGPLGHVAVNDRAAQDARRRAEQERGAKLREQVMNDRAAYRRRLAELGLQDPSIESMPGGSSGFGM